MLDAVGRPIEGLYSVGNNAASVMGPVPRRRLTLGPAMTFAYRAVAHGGRPIPLAHTELLGAGA